MSNKRAPAAEGLDELRCESGGSGVIGTCPSQLQMPRLTFSNTS
jgi:hypothetical protein